MKCYIVSNKTICTIIIIVGFIISFQPAYAASKEKEIAKIKQVWTSFVKKLSMKNIEGALDYIIEERKESYREAFSAIKDKLPEVMSKKEDLQINDVSEYMATGENIVRENGGVYSYPVTFIKQRGQWKIQSF